MTFSWTRRTQISTNNQIYIPIIDNLLYQLCYEIPCIVENTLYLQRFVNVWWYGHKLGTRHSSVYLFNKDSGSNSVGHGPKCWPLIWTSPPRGCLLFGKSRGQPFPNLFRNSLWLQLRQIITDGLISVKNNKKTSLNMFLFYLSSYKKKNISLDEILGEKHKHNVGYKSDEKMLWRNTEKVYRSNFTLNWWKSVNSLKIS